MTTWRFDSSSSSTWKYASGRSSLEKIWPRNKRSNTFSIWGRGYWVRSRYWLTDTLKSPQIRTWPLGLSTGTIGVVLNSAVSTLLMMPKDSNRSSSASTLGRRAYGTNRGLNSLKLEFGLMWRWTLNPLIRRRVDVSKRSLNSVRSDVRDVGTVSGWVWCTERRLHSAIHSRQSREAMSGRSRKTTRSCLDWLLSRTSTLATPRTGMRFRETSLRIGPWRSIDLPKRFHQSELRRE